MSSAGAVTSTLRHVTDRKLSKLAEHQKHFEANKRSILEAVQKQKRPADKVAMLVQGHKRFAVKLHNGNGKSLSNISHFLDQARHDPSVSNSLLGEWQTWLEQNLEIQSDKYNYAVLFGQLLTEWIEKPNETLLRPASPDSDADFEITGRKEMYEQRKQWEEKVFTEKKTDKTRIHAYLDGLFASNGSPRKTKKSDLESLRDRLKKLGDIPALTERSLRSAIKGLLRSDLFSGQKREALIDLQSRPEVLKEMVDVLQMDLKALNTWEWEPSPVPLNMRKQLNGKYRVYMDEEIHQALFLHIIGASCAVTFKKAFQGHLRSWTQSPHHSMNKKDYLRRQHFLGKGNVRPRGPDSSVHEIRRHAYNNDFFMTQLPSKINEGYRSYGDEKEEAEDDTKSPMEIKQLLLRLISTEMVLNTELYDEFTILQSDFQWFGPSLPHSTIYAILEYFSVKPDLISFFKKVLESPLVFAHDGPEAETHVRKCGVPMSHVLSDALGEMIMFCLDLAVNKKTHGRNLYRFHDDLWFWGQESACIDAWNALQEFSAVMGLELNMEKTAAAKVVKADAKSQPKASLDPSLPKGEVRWGFLILDAEAGRWKIDQNSVDEHTKELRRQLEACRSVLAWVQAWNSYVAQFFTNNFGKPSYSLGREHIDMAIKAFETIQQAVFGDAGNVADHLRSVIESRFNVPGHNIPDAFFYLPAELGGLELRNPFVHLYGVRPDSKKSPQDILRQGLADDEVDYEHAKEEWDQGEHHDNADRVEADEPFMSFEEFTRFREQTSVCLRSKYKSLLEPYKQCSLVRTAVVDNALNSLSDIDNYPSARGLGGTNLLGADEEDVLSPDEDSDSSDSESVRVPGEARGWSTRGFGSNWFSMDSYWQWIVSLYASEMMRRFGGLALGERSLLPIGLVSMLRSEKTRWQG
ncbi:uncharacterized protein K452DRAFT_284744 [Aplosporella prunicola CBS 121167]|uniref:Uncharacterized protein n=1 Tax=Aplosporella prunicola CBS 121167 TaxID=1176127 RepID=A0A6A6BNL5_9PEZI|nr:uncharacterized protein K452DRAFT_284744 [Aplosporella prunicola CBS 121167]KAF2144427.1 hypothetical protein K452DRAFT_284744 [Aplosporella prunicola CBS 121167]